MTTTEKRVLFSQAMRERKKEYEMRKKQREALGAFKEPEPNVYIDRFNVLFDLIQRLGLEDEFILYAGARDNPEVFKNFMANNAELFMED